MSWAEIFRVNNNIKKSINELLCDAMYNPIRIITVTGTYTPEKTGKYRVICIGAGADHGYRYPGSSVHYFGGGGGGGVAIKDMVLSSGTSYNVTVSTTASFGNIMTATGGTAFDYSSSSSNTVPVGGTASGGDYNYTGETGETGLYSSTNKVYTVKGGSVGVNIADLSRRYFFNNLEAEEMSYGRSILRYGGGAPCGYLKDDGDVVYRYSGFPAAILIIPLEMEE